MRIVLWWRNLYPTKDRATGVTNSGTRRRIVRNLGYAGSAGRKDTWRETVIQIIIIATTTTTRIIKEEAAKVSLGV